MVVVTLSKTESMDFARSKSTQFGRAQVESMSKIQDHAPPEGDLKARRAYRQRSPHQRPI